jgi:hypothetical protein
MVILALRVLSHFKDEGVKPAGDPANRTLLFRDFQTLVKIERMRKYFLRFFERDSAPGLALNRLLLRTSKSNRILV